MSDVKSKSGASSEDPTGPVKIGLFDIDGVLRGKYVSAQKFKSILEGGFGFCDVVLGWDVNDQLYEAPGYTGWHKGYPDAQARLLPDTLRKLPFEEGQLFCLGEFSGDAETVCPRAMLRRVLGRVADFGYEVLSGFEYEFIVFNETPQSARDKNYRDLTPLAPGNFGYSVLRNSEGADFYTALWSELEDMGISLEGLHEETGPGVLEAAIAVNQGISSADNAALFKTFSKVIAHRLGKLLTFMSRVDMDSPGQGGHVHLSLKQMSDGRSVFFDGSKENGISQTMGSFVAGLQRLVPELLVLAAPTINSYRRLMPGFWAPTSATFGIDNRTCSVRAIPGSEKSQRIEFRAAGADANPYLALSMILVAGLEGIEQGWTPDAAISGNAYEQDIPEDRHFPASLSEAAERFSRSDVARKWFGDAFVDHYVVSRLCEVDAFNRQVTDWERARYFEII